MKKSYLYAIIAVLTLIIVIGGIYIAMLGKDKGEPKEETLNTIVLNTVEEENGLFKEKFDIEINGKKKTLEVNFTTGQGTEKETITGSINGETVYVHEQIATESDPNVEELTKNYIEKNFNIDHFKFIKGEDEKYYLIVLIKEDTFSGPNYYMTVFNDNFKRVKGDTEFAPFIDHKDVFTISFSGITMMFKDIDKKWYEDDFGICQDSFYSGNCHIFAESMDDKIMYLKVSENYDYLEEFAYTIKDDKLISKKQDKKYPVETVGGTAW